MPLIGAIGAAAAKAFGITNVIAAIQGLYSFSTFTFTNAGATGRTGPTLSNCLSSYDTGANSWLNNTSYFNVVTQGIQLWTVPRTGTYEIDARGARGGAGAAGTSNAARCVGRFTLTQGDIIKILVGQQGLSGSSGCGPAMSGGGGGTFVTTNANSPLIVAGGGGGTSSDTRSTVYNANFNSTSGNQGQDTGGDGGTGGNGGSYRSGQCVNNSGAGGGLNTDGGQAAGQSTGGKAFVNGGEGGTGFADYGGTPAAGGFGGGGATNTYMGGGGGGYSGGGCGGVASCSCTFIGGGGGGGSFNNGTSQTNEASTQNNGSVVITFIS